MQSSPTQSCVSWYGSENCFRVSTAAAEKILRVLRTLLGDVLGNTNQKRATMNPNQALWEKGDFTRIAESMRQRGDGEPMCWVSISRGTLLRLHKSARRKKAWRTAGFRQAMRPICMS